MLARRVRPAGVLAVTQLLLLLLLLCPLAMFVIAESGEDGMPPTREYSTQPYPPGEFGVPQGPLRSPPPSSAVAIQASSDREKDAEDDTWSRLRGSNEDDVATAELLQLFVETSSSSSKVDNSLSRPHFDTFPVAQPMAGEKRPYWVSPYEYTNFGVVINNQLVHAYLIRVPDPLNHFSIQEPLHGCPGFTRTSVTAEDRRCVAATNAGFFDVHRGYCLGNVVSDGRVVHARESRNANWGMTASGEFVYGYLTAAQVESMQFKQLVTGVTWLLRNGTIYVEESAAIEQPSFDFVWMKAPRVAIGNNAAGEVLVLQVDGNEPLDQGLDLYEFAQLAKDRGFVNAINLDGGGSSVTTVNYKAVSHPSDNCGTSTAKCERMVTTITCVKA